MRATSYLKNSAAEGDNDFQWEATRTRTGRCRQNRAWQLQGRCQQKGVWFGEIAPLKGRITGTGVRNELIVTAHQLWLVCFVYENAGLWDVISITLKTYILTAVIYFMYKWVMDPLWDLASCYPTQGLLPFPGKTSWSCGDVSLCPLPPSPPSSCRKKGVLLGEGASSTRSPCTFSSGCVSCHAPSTSAAGCADRGVLTPLPELPVSQGLLGLSTGTGSCRRKPGKREAPRKEEEIQQSQALCPRVPMMSSWPQMRAQNQVQVERRVKTLPGAKLAPCVFPPPQRGQLEHVPREATPLLFLQLPCGRCPDEQEGTAGVKVQAAWRPREQRRLEWDGGSEPEHCTLWRLSVLAWRKAEGSVGSLYKDTNPISEGSILMT